MQMLMGIDLGGTNTRVALAGENGLVAEESFSTLAARGPEGWLARLAPVAHELYTTFDGTAKSPVWFLGPHEPFWS